MSGTLDSFVTSSSPPPRIIAQSQSIYDRSSIFKAYIYRATSTAQSGAAVAYTRNVLHAKTPTSNPATHEMRSWRLMVLRKGRSGLDGPDDFILEEGSEDDGEEFGGKRILRTMREEGILDAVVVCSRWYGGTMLGPARFTHIENATREVCIEFKSYEQVEECILELKDLDSTLVNLRAELAALTGTPTASGAQNSPDYTSMLNPPDVEKAKRLVKARQSAIKGVQTLITKKKS